MLRNSPYVCAYSFDPGDSTGVTRVQYGPGPGVTIRLWTFSQEEFMEFLSVEPIVDTPRLLMYESFISRAGLFSRTQVAPEIVGAIKLWAKLGRFSLLSIQPSQTHKIRREDVKAAGWTWKTEHEFDAIRILIYGLTMLRYGPDASAKL